MAYALILDPPKENSEQVGKIAGLSPRERLERSFKVLGVDLLPLESFRARQADGPPFELILARADRVFDFDILKETAQAKEKPFIWMDGLPAAPIGLARIRSTDEQLLPQTGEASIRVDWQKISQSLEMIHLKTAVLLGFAMELGARIGGANDEQITLVREFGENLGIGFQLKDDILDIYGDHVKFGKQVGGDIRENKKTFLWIEALKMANDDQNRLLVELSSAKELDSDRKVNEVKKIYDDLNIKAHSEERMNTYFDKAFEALDILQTSEERKLPLHDFVQALINREK